MNSFNCYLFPSSPNLPFDLAKNRELSKILPPRGNHILGAYTVQNIVLYLPVRESIAKYAVLHQGFNRESPDFNHLTHLSVRWVLRTGFMATMYATQWATREPDCEAILALSISRIGFEGLLRAAVSDRGRANAGAKVTWEPDRNPIGQPLTRGVPLLRLRGEALKRLLADWLVGVADVSPFVRRMRGRVLCGAESKLLVPHERAYGPMDGSLVDDLGIDPPPVTLPTSNPNDGPTELGQPGSESSGSEDSDSEPESETEA